MPDGRPPTEVYSQWPLWGGTARLVVRAGDDPRLAEAALGAAQTEVDAVVGDVDAACSRFRADSEVARLARAGGGSYQISEVLTSAVAAALRGARLTDGAVDPTLGHALVAAGYDRDIALVRDADQRAGPAPPAPSSSAGEGPDQPTSSRLVRTATWRDVQLDQEAGVLTVPDDVLLDLGATAKAFASDRAAARAHDAVGMPVLVSLCGDIAVAGTRPSEPWVVRVVETPDEQDGPLVEVHDGGLATSTTRARRWVRSGRPMHHLLDPVTGLPADEVWRTVTVAAATCLDANIASTATVVKGADGLRWLESTGLPARVVAADGAVRTVGGWPA
jgi:FAD:protein FMN transferase